VIGTKTTGRSMPGGRQPSFNPFTCPNCSAYYQVVEVEAGPETDNRDIACRFLLRKAIASRQRA
jgi:hypothetical protein